MERSTLAFHRGTVSLAHNVTVWQGQQRGKKKWDPERERDESESVEYEHSHARPFRPVLEDLCRI